MSVTTTKMADMAEKMRPREDSDGAKREREALVAFLKDLNRTWDLIEGTLRATALPVGTTAKARDAILELMHRHDKTPYALP